VVILLIIWYRAIWVNITKLKNHHVPLSVLLYHSLGDEDDKDGGTWLAQWVECMTLDLRVVSLSPTLGVEIT